jgi:hypothetical protein
MTRKIWPSSRVVLGHAMSRSMADESKTVHAWTFDSAMESKSTKLFVEAVCVIVQYQLENGSPLFEV